jgi:hypothetical protein
MRARDRALLTFIAVWCIRTTYLSCGRMLSNSMRTPRLRREQGGSNEPVVGFAIFGDQEALRAANAELTKVSLARSRSSVRRSSKMRVAASGKPIKSLPARLIRSPS